MEIQYFEGIEGIKILFEKTLQNHEKILRTVLADKPLVYLAGKKFSNEYMRKRNKEKVFLKSLRGSSNDIDLPQHKDYQKYNKEVKIAPKEITFEKSMVIWDTYVAIIDTKNISGVLINNNENATIMKQWFDFVWEKS